MTNSELKPHPINGRILINFFFLTAIITLLSCPLYSQNVGIGQTSFTPNSSAGLDVNFTNKGLLIPRVALTSANSNSPIGNGIATSLMVYNTDTAGTYPDQVQPGFYYWDGTKWKTLGYNWHRDGNGGTLPGTDFIGTTDTQNLVFKVNNQIAGLIDQTSSNNTFFGYQAGSNVTADGESNAFYGFQSGINTTIGIRNTTAGAFTLYSNIQGSFNNAIGTYSLYFNTGDENSANGYAALYSNISGSENTASGAYALNNNSIGSNNTAGGYAAMSSNKSGDFNTAIGFYTLVSNEAGSHNVAIGNNALYHYLFSGNTAVGDGALAANTDDGSGGDAFNTAIGFEVLTSTTIGINNTGNGYHALYANTTGNNNVGLGFNAGLNNATGSGNIFIGNQAGSNETGSDKLYISNSNTSFPLIGGDFSSGVVNINSIVKLKPATAPTSPVAGTIYFDSSSNKLRCYDGTIWHNLW